MPLVLCIGDRFTDLGFCLLNFSFFFYVKLGLRYDDLYDPMYDLDVKEAMNRLPREIVDARNQRLKRAMDLSMKHEYLQEDLQVIFDYSEIVYRLFWCTLRRCIVR